MFQLVLRSASIARQRAVGQRVLPAFRWNAFGGQIAEEVTDEKKIPQPRHHRKCADCSFGLGCLLDVLALVCGEGWAAAVGPRIAALTLSTLFRRRVRSPTPPEPRYPKRASV